MLCYTSYYFRRYWYSSMVGCILVMYCHYSVFIGEKMIILHKANERIRLHTKEQKIVDTAIIKICIHLGELVESHDGLHLTEKGRKALK